MAYTISGLAGINLTRTDSTALFPLGTIAFGTDSTVWEYVEFGSAVAQYEWVAIDENNLALVGTSALADVQHRIGIAQTTFTSAEYGWVVTNGRNISGKVSASVSADVVLHTSATAGNFSAVTSGSEIEGITVVTALSTAGAVEVILNHPHRDFTGASN